MKNNKSIIIAVIGILIAGGGLLAWKTLANQEELAVAGDSTARQVTMYKSPTCACCGQHAAYLERNGFEVEIVKTSNMSAIKDKYGIPRSSESCHTIVAGDYIIEGHMPVEAINKLLAEQPDIDGIALPDMPAGSPGMPGVKKEPFEIQALKDGSVSEYMSL